MPYGDLVLPLIFGPIILVAVAFSVRAVIGVMTIRRDAAEELRGLSEKYEFFEKLSSQRR